MQTLPRQSGRGVVISRDILTVDNEGAFVAEASELPGRGWPDWIVVEGPGTHRGLFEQRRTVRDADNDVVFVEYVQRSTATCLRIFND